MIDWRNLFDDTFEDAAVLITGGAGFIGSHLCESLARLGARVTVLDDLSGGDRDNLAGFGDRVRFIEGSILEPDVLAEAAAGCRYVFHQAALGSVPRSVEMPERYHQVNATGTFNVLSAAQTAGVRRVMFAASSSAYGDPTPGDRAKIETMPVRPLSPYAATKVAGEALLRAFANCYDLDTVSLRYFNVFGPRQNANSAYAAVIAAFATSLLAGQAPVVFGDGEQSRDFTFVANAVYANLLAAASDRPLRGEVYNVACGARVTVNQLATRMAALLDHPELSPTQREPRAGDVRHSLADLSAIRADLGYEPLVDLDTGLEATVGWYASTMERA